MIYRHIVRWTHCCSHGTQIIIIDCFLFISLIFWNTLFVDVLLLLLIVIVFLAWYLWRQTNYCLIKPFMFWNSDCEWYFTTRNCVRRKHYIYAKREVMHERIILLLIMCVRCTIVIVLRLWDGSRQLFFDCVWQNVIEIVYLQISEKDQFRDLIDLVYAINHA